MTEQFAHVSYDLIPEHMRESVRGYLEFGWRPGGFLRAALANDLAYSYRNADSINRAAMPQWAEWLYWECPEPAWGSEQRVDEWCQRRRRHEATRDGASRPCADCDSGAENIPPHDCTKYAKEKAL